MKVNYETEKINKTLYDFYNSTGITIDLLKTDFNPVSKAPYEFNNYCKCIHSSDKGAKACRMSEISLLENCKKTKQAQMHICHAGLVDIAVPILYNDDIIGYIIFGQMKTNTDFSLLENYLIKLNLDTDKMKNHYDMISYYDSEKIQSVSNIASMLVKYLLLENMLKPDLNEGIERAVNFINDNLEKNLSIKLISKSSNISKTVLYKKFHEHFDCTISEYINSKRVEKSKELLKKTDMSIEEISQRVGFTNASYYSKTFKKLNNLSPLKFRKLST